MSDARDIVERLRFLASGQDDVHSVAITEAAAEITRLRAEAVNLRTVMVAAAKEIAAHWDVHCDAEGYGPTNLQRRLEDGIPSLYGYTAGAFAELKAENERLRALSAQPAAVTAEPTGWICRHKPQVVDAEKAFPGRPHDYLWRYTHGTRDMAACESYGDFDVVRLYAAAPPGDDGGVR